MFTNVTFQAAPYDAKRDQGLPAKRAHIKEQVPRHAAPGNDTSSAARQAALYNSDDGSVITSVELGLPRFDIAGHCRIAFPAPPS
jgi:hypothetical protein